MSYKEFIQNIIKTRGQWNISKDEYYEKHHIVPKCLGGVGSTYKKDSNIIWLYPEEHYTAHKLLYLENKNNYKLAHAWLMMAFIKDKNQERYYPISEQDYKLLKQVKRMCSKEVARSTKRNHVWNKNISEGQKGNVRGHWYNNGEYSVQAVTCPEGFVLGRLDLDIKKITATKKLNNGWVKTPDKRDKISKTIKAKNCRWYNNGEVEFQIASNDLIPKGFVLGRIKRNQPTHKKSVAQLDLSGTLIKIWDSMSTASNTLHIPLSSISLVCANKQKTACGFIWRYIDE